MSGAFGSSLTSKRRSPTRSAKPMPAPPAFGCHPAVGGNEVIGTEVQALRGEIDERLARGCCRLADLHAPALDAVRAGGASLVGCQRGVALDISDLVEADAELLGGDLRNSDPQPLAEIDLAAEDRHRAVAVDGEERIDLLRVEHPRRAAGDLPGQSTRQAGQGKADSQGAALEQRAARDGSTFGGRVHVSLPVPMLPAPRGRPAHAFRNGRDCHPAPTGFPSRSALGFQAAAPRWS